MHTMKCATLYGMPKLLACCEYYIVLGSSSLQTTMVATGTPTCTVLKARCLSEPMLRRSWSHIAECFCFAFRRLAVQISCRQSCKCVCCRVGRKDPGWASSNCHLAATTEEELSSFLPSPMELLKMAAADRS